MAKLMDQDGQTKYQFTKMRPDSLLNMTIKKKNIRLIMDLKDITKMMRPHHMFLEKVKNIYQHQDGYIKQAIVKMKIHFVEKNLIITIIISKRAKSVII